MDSLSQVGIEEGDHRIFKELKKTNDRWIDNQTDNYTIVNVNEKIS